MIAVASACKCKGWFPMLCWSSKIWPKCYVSTFSIIWWCSPHRGWHSSLVNWASIYKIFPCFNPTFTKFQNIPDLGMWNAHLGAISGWREKNLSWPIDLQALWVCTHPCTSVSIYSDRFRNALCSRPSLGKESPLAWSKSFGYTAVIVLATIPCSVHHFGEVYNIERVASSRC